MYSRTFLKSRWGSTGKPISSGILIQGITRLFKNCRTGGGAHMFDYTLFHGLRITLKGNIKYFVAGLYTAGCYCIN